MVDFNSVLSAARQLTEEEQMRLVDALWSPTDDDADCPLDEAWKAELERRVARMDAGTVTLVPWEQVRSNARLRAGLNDVD